MTTQTTNWATPDDLEAHRGLITQLYLVQNRPLKQVVEIMRDQYGINATQKMYKARFEKWQLRKNLTVSTVSQIIDSGGNSKANSAVEHPVLRGRRVDRRKLRRYIQRLPAEKRQSILSESEQRLGYPIRAELALLRPQLPMASRRHPPSSTPSISMLFSPTAPDDLRLSEEFLHHLRVYVSGALDQGRWAVQDKSGWLVADRKDVIAWYDMGDCALGLFSRGQTRHAFRFLNRCVELFRGLLETQGPWLGLYVYFAALALAVPHPDLARNFVRYTYELARICHGEAHPLPQLLRGLGRLQPWTSIGATSGHLLEAYVTVFERRLSATSLFATVMRSYIVYAMSLHGMLGVASAQAELRTLTARLEPHADIVGNEILRIRLNQAVLDARRGSGREVMGLLNAVLGHEQPHPIAARFPDIVSSYQHVRYAVRAHIGTATSQLVEAARHRVAFCRAHLGWGHVRTVQALADLEGVLRQNGQADEAGRTQANLDTAMDAVCGPIGRLSP